MFNEKTSAGYKILTIIPDGDQEHVIAKRSMSWGDDYDEKNDGVLVVNY